MEADITDERPTDDPSGWPGPTIPPAAEGPGAVEAGANDDFFRSLQLPSPTDLSGPEVPPSGLPVETSPPPAPAAPTMLTTSRPAERRETRRAHFVATPTRARRRLPVPVIAAAAGAAALVLVVVGIVLAGGDSESVTAQGRQPFTRAIPTVPRTVPTIATALPVAEEEPAPEVTRQATKGGSSTTSTTEDPGVIDPPVTETQPPTPPPAPVVPDPPTGLSATPDATVIGDVMLTWSAPASDGGSAITGYLVQIDGGTAIPTTGFSYLASGLGEGSHAFTVAAVNAVGTGVSAMTTATVPPATPPSTAAPTAGDLADSVGSASPEVAGAVRTAEPLPATRPRRTTVDGPAPV